MARPTCWSRSFLLALVLLALAALFLAAPPAARAQSVTWVGGSSNFWGDGANWSPYSGFWYPENRYWRGLGGPASWTCSISNASITLAAPPPAGNWDHPDTSAGFDPTDVVITTLNTSGSVSIGAMNSSYSTLYATFNNSGALTLGPGVNLSGALNNYGSVNFPTGAASSLGDVYNYAGASVMFAGNISVQGVLNNSASVNVQTYSQLIVQENLSNNGSASFDNYGSVFVQGALSNSASLNVHTYSQLNLQGDLTNSPGGSLTLDGSASVNGSLSNSASVTVDPYGNLNVQGDLTNNPNASLTVDGVAWVQGALTNNANIKVDSYASLGANGDFANNPGASIQVNGSLSGGSFTNNGSLMLMPGGNLSADNAFVNNTQVLMYLNATIGGGSFTNAFGASITGAGAVHADSTLTNAGAITSLGANLMLFAPSGPVTNTGTLVNSPGTTLIVYAPSFTQSGTITVNANGGFTATCAFTNQTGATIQLLGGTLAAPTITQQSGATFSGFGTISGNLVNQGTITFTGPTTLIGDATNQSAATLNFQNGANYISGLTTNNGTITLSNASATFAGGLLGNPISDLVSSAATPAGTPLPTLTGALIIGPGTHVVAACVQQHQLTIQGSLTAIGTLALAPSSAGGGVSVLDSLTLAGTPAQPYAQLDLADNDFILRSSAATRDSDYSALTALVASGRAGGSWTGLGITSSAAADADTQHELYALAVVRNSDLANPYNSTNNLFDGQPVDANSILVKYTLVGDATLTGRISLDDYLILDASYRFGLDGKGWAGGDFNGDGVVDYQDYALIDYGYAQQSGAAAAAGLITLHTQEFGSDYTAALAALETPVPEPGSLALLSLSTLMLLRRPKHAARAGRAVGAGE